MRPAPFRYARPTELVEALELLAEHGDRAAVLAGGQSLVPLLAARWRRPELLVDINRLPGLDRIEVDARGVTVGALARQRAVERHAAANRAIPLLAQALPWVGRVGTRNRGTVAGSVAFADPAAELPSVLVASGGEVSVRSAAGTRVIAAKEFFLGAGRTALTADELIVAVRFGAPNERTTQCWLEYGRRPGDLPLVGVAAALTRDERGRVSAVRAVFAGVRDRPWPLPEELGRDLLGQPPSEEAIAELAHKAASGADPGTDQRTTADHRRLLVATLLRRALRRCAGMEERTHAA